MPTWFKKFSVRSSVLHSCRPLSVTNTDNVSRSNASDDRASRGTLKPRHDSNYPRRDSEQYLCGLYCAIARYSGEGRSYPHARLQTQRAWPDYSDERRGLRPVCTRESQPPSDNDRIYCLTLLEPESNSYRRSRIYARVYIKNIGVLCIVLQDQAYSLFHRSVR